MSNYEEDQSEDGELAQSPVAKDEMDFSLSDEDMDHADSLHIKPPQASIRPSHRERRGHKSSGRDRHKEHPRREKKHLLRDREKHDKVKRDTVMDMNTSERDVNNAKEFSRDKLYHREKEHRDKEVYREKDHYREKLYRENESFHPEKDTYREKESYRMKETHIKEKDSSKDKDSQREFWNRETRQRHELERRVDIRRTFVEDHRDIRHNEKENKDKSSSGDKELEDLRSRLLSKRRSKEQQTHPDKSNDRLHAANNQSVGEKESSNSTRVESKRRKSFDLDKNQQDKRNRFIEAEREMARRKESSRTELEARRERRRGEKRSVTPEDAALTKRMRPAHASTAPAGSPSTLPASTNDDDDVVLTVSDQSDLEVRSEDYDQPQSEQEEGEHSGTESESDSSYSESETDTDSNTSPPPQEGKRSNPRRASPHSPHSPASRTSRSPPSDKSQRSLDSRHSSGARRRSRSVTRSRSRSNSRSNSFSPPPPGTGQTSREHDGQNQHASALTESHLDDTLPPYYPALQGCRSVEEFQCLNRIEEGTYGVVYRARDKSTEEIVALKRLKMEREREGFPITSLREINTLLKGQHPNVVTVREIVVGSNMDKIFIVMDYVEHDLRSLMDTMREKKQVFLPGEVKCLMQQLLRAVFHLHDNWILHRDLKTSNLLLSHKGILKVGDFGLAREYGSPLRHYTSTVVTLWYRAPELLLLCKQYSTAIDMWSVGCIFAEFVTMNPLFPGKAEMDQINRIFKELGTPSESIWPGYSKLPAVQKVTFAETGGGGLRARAGPDLLSELGFVLLQALLTYDPTRRITADAALEHAYFKEQPVAIDPAMFPTWPAKSEGGRRAPGAPRTPPPPARHRDQDDQNDHNDHSLGFHMGSAAGANAASGREHNVSSGGGFSLKF